MPNISDFPDNIQTAIHKMQILSGNDGTYKGNVTTGRSGGNFNFADFYNLEVFQLADGEYKKFEKKIKVLDYFKPREYIIPDSLEEQNELLEILHDFNLDNDGVNYMLYKENTAEKTNLLGFCPFKKYALIEKYNIPYGFNKTTFQEFKKRLKPVEKSEWAKFILANE